MIIAVLRADATRSGCRSCGEQVYRCCRMLVRTPEYSWEISGSLDFCRTL